MHRDQQLPARRTPWRSKVKKAHGEETETPGLRKSRIQGDPTPMGRVMQDSPQAGGEEGK